MECDDGVFVVDTFKIEYARLVNEALYVKTMAPMHRHISALRDEDKAQEGAGRGE